MFVTSLLLAALTSAPVPHLRPCPVLAGDPLQYVPTAATTVAGVDVDALAKTAVGRALLPALRADLQMAEALEILDDCGVELARTYTLVAARDAGDGRVLVVQGFELGKAKTLGCVRAELEARGEGSVPWTRVEHSCGARLDLSDGSQAWVVNDYTLVWARGAFAASVGPPLEGERPMERPVSEFHDGQAFSTTGPLAAALARVDRGAQLWLATRLDDSDRAALGAAWARDTDVVTAHLDVSGGLHATATFSAPDVAALARLREQLLVALLALADRLDDYGVEHQLRSRTRLGIVDELVAVELELDASELQAIRERITERVIGRGPL